MHRLVKTELGAVIDERQILPGRGVYVHQECECLEKAIKRGSLARALKCAVSQDLMMMTRK